MNGLLCGSISSVAIAISTKYGRTSFDENPQQVWDMVDRYVAEFKDKFGHANYRQLTGLNLKTKEGLKEYFAKVHNYACAARIRFAVKKALEILEK